MKWVEGRMNTRPDAAIIGNSQPQSLRALRQVEVQLRLTGEIDWAEPHN